MDTYWTNRFFRGNSSFIMQELEDTDSLLDLNIQEQEVVKERNPLFSQNITNAVNNNFNPNINNNQTETGCVY